MQYSSSIYTWMAKRARNSRYTCVFWIRITWWLGGVSATATSIWTHAVPKSHKNSNSTHGGQQLQVRYYVLEILQNTFIFCNVRMQILKVVNWVGRTDFQNGEVVKYYARVNFQSNISIGFCYIFCFQIWLMFMNRIPDSINIESTDKCTFQIMDCV